MVYYYKKKFPSINDIVIANVEKISAIGIEVSLNEYNGMKGFINCSEVSRKKKVNFNKLLMVGKDVLLNVLLIDEVKQLIDLSKKTINDDDIKLFGEKHKLHIQLYNIFKNIFMRIKNINRPENINDDELHNFLCVSLFEIQNHFENEYICQKIILKENNLEFINLIDFSKLDYSIDEFKNVLDNYIDNKINRTKPEKTETIKLMTYSSTGLADIKFVLDYKSFTDYAELSKDYEINLNYISGSVYSIIIKQKEFDLSSSILLDDALISIKREIKKRALDKQMQNQIV